MLAPNGRHYATCGIRHLAILLYLAVIADEKGAVPGVNGRRAEVALLNPHGSRLTKTPVPTPKAVGRDVGVEVVKGRARRPGPGFSIALKTQVGVPLGPGPHVN